MVTIKESQLPRVSDEISDYVYNNIHTYDDVTRH